MRVGIFKSVKADVKIPKENIIIQINLLFLQKNLISYETNNKRKTRGGCFCDFNNYQFEEVQIEEKEPVNFSRILEGTICLGGMCVDEEEEVLESRFYTDVEIVEIE